MNLPHESAREIVKRLKESYFPGFHSLPFNRYEPAKSRLWWLSPRGENPAFHLAKISVIVEDDRIEEELGFSGFSVEKGLETDMPSKAGDKMKPNWFWHEFLTLANHPLAGVISEAETALGEPLEIFIQAALNEGASTTQVLLNHDAGRLSCQDKENKGPLAPVADLD